MTDDDRARGNNNLVLTESNCRTSPQKIRSGQGSLAYWSFEFYAIRMQSALGARARQLATRPFAVMVIECWTTHKMQSATINMFALVL